MTTAEKVIEALQGHAGFDDWWENIDKWDDVAGDTAQGVIDAINTVISSEVSAELAYLRWFHSYADFGPADDDVRTMMQAEYAATVAPVPDGYSWSDDEDD